MMLSPGAIGAVSEVLDADGRDFYRESHAKIYRAALALYAKGEPVDAITLVDELDERSDLEDVGGADRIHELAALVPASANARHYAQIVHETAILRGLIRAGGEIARLGWERPGDDDDARRPGRADRLRARPGARRRASSATSRSSSRRASSGSPHLYELGARRHRRPVRLPRLRPAHVRLPGGQPDHPRRPPGHGEVGARRSAWPRTSRCAPRYPVALFTLEMSKAEVTQRLMCAEAKVELHRLRTGRLAGRRLAAPDRRVRPAREGADLRRRHRLDHDDGDPRRRRAGSSRSTRTSG